MTIAIFIFEINFLRALKSESRINLLFLLFKKGEFRVVGGQSLKADNLN